MQLISLSFKTTNNFDNNLNTLVNLINQTPSNSIIVAPEICLSGYVYDRLDKASKISLKAIKILQQLSTNKIISTTFIIKQNNCFYNMQKLLFLTILLFDIHHKVLYIF